MISPANRMTAIRNMSVVPVGTVVIIEFTDGRLMPVQKFSSKHWCTVGTAGKFSAEDIMEPMNIKRVDIHLEFTGERERND